MEENPVHTPKKSVLKRLSKVVFWLFFSVLIVCVSLITLLFVYEDEVKAAIVTELNKHLKAEVKIDPKNIDLTIIKTFPDCSIQFNNLLMLEALQVKNRDTLLFAGQLNLHFNISNLWNKKYDIEKIKLKDAITKLSVSQNGTPNYIFWEENKTQSSGKQDSINFNLKLVSIENCRLSYTNAQELFKTSLDIKTIDFSGNFGQSQFDLKTNASLFIHHITHEKNTYIKNKTLDFSIDLAVAQHNYAFKKTQIRLNNLALELNGGFAYNDSLQNLSVTFNAPNLDIASVLSLLPESFKHKINSYESTGNFYATGKIDYAGKESYSIASNFGIKNGSVTYKPQSTTAKNINVDGSLTLTNASSMLDLKNIYIRLNNDELKGNCLIKNFSDPYIRLNSQASLRLENLQSFFPIDTLAQLSGGLTLSSAIEGALKDLKNETFSTKVKLNLNASLTNLIVRFKNDEQVFAIENCSITAHEREVEVKDLRLKRGSSDIILSGKIPGLFNYLLDRKAPLIISGNLVSDYIRLEDFIPRATGKQSNSSGGALIPENIQFKLNAGIARFTFAKFEARSVSGEIDIKDQKAVISDMNLETMQGSAEINAFADNSKNRLDVAFESKLKNINIQELFVQFNNFGQTTLQDKNIKGFASATIDFSGTWNNKLEASYPSIRANCNLLIERGELIDFKPLLSLSKFVDVEDLKRIKFAALQSTVQIDNSTITFPKTSIKNSALNIDFWGTHTFDNKIDYHIRLLISELLAKKRKNKEEEFGPIEKDNDNKRSAFILMKGTIDKPVMAFDKKGLKEKIREDIKEERKNTRQLLKEIGLFKKDSLIRKNKSDQHFELEKPSNNPPKKTLELKKKDEEDF